MMYPVTPILEHDQHLPIFVEQMRDAGIDLQLEPQDFGRWVENIRALNYDCTLNLNQIYETPEVPLGIHTKSGPFGDGTYLRGLGDPTIEDAVARTSTILDTDERVAAVHEAQRLIYERDPVSLPLVSAYSYIAWRREVKNVPAGIGTSSFLINTFWMDT
jgi:ABC-type transport system substrate-binding protein